MDLSPRWILVGSTAMALQGAPLKPHDIDIKTTAEDVYLMEKALIEYSMLPVVYRTSKKFRSHFGKLKIEGVMVEIMGGLEIWHPERGWITSASPQEYRHVIEVEGMNLPVLDPSYSILTNRWIGRNERADLVEKWYKSQQNSTFRSE